MWSQSPVPAPKKFWCTRLTTGLMTPVYSEVLRLRVCPKYQADEPECTERGELEYRRRMQAGLGLRAPGQLEQLSSHHWWAWGTE